MIDEIQQRLVDAMKSHDKKYVSILRDIKSNLEEKKKVKKKDLTESECFEVLNGMVKKHRQSIEACGDHYKYQTLKQQEEFELNVIEKYLPEKLSQEKIHECIMKIIDIKRISGDMKNLGKVMKCFNEQHPYQNGKVVSKIARELLIL